MVRQDNSQSEVLFQTSDTTWQAYNLYGGANTYYGLSPPYRRAHKVSYNRPWQTRATRAINILFGAEYPMIRWLESHGYDVSYQSGIDTDRCVLSSSHSIHMMDTQELSGVTLKAQTLPLSGSR